MKKDNFIVGSADDADTRMGSEDPQERIKLA